LLQKPGAVDMALAVLELRMSTLLFAFGWLRICFTVNGLRMSTHFEETA
jgi:hypothetical protein